MQKALLLLEDVAGEVGRKKEASRQVKALRAELSSVQNEMDDIEAQLRTLRGKSERIALWARQHQHQVRGPGPWSMQQLACALGGLCKVGGNA